MNTDGDGRVNNSQRSGQTVRLDEQTPLIPIKEDNEHGAESTQSAADGPQERASFTGSVFNLSTTIIGAGIMALPAAMKVLGLGLGIVTIVFVALLTERSLELLMRFSRVGENESYGGVMHSTFGKFGTILLKICVIVNNVGILVVYMIIIGDVLSGTSSNAVHHAGVLEGWFGEHWWNGRIFVLLVTTLVILTPLAFLKRIDSLKYSSALAVALAVVFVLITAGITVAKLMNGSIAMPRFLPHVTDIKSIWNLFTAVPVIVTAFVCHYNVHSIDDELGDPSLIQGVVRSSLFLCSTVYLLTSIFGYLLFGDGTLDDVLSNFDTDLGIPHSNLLNDIVRLSYAVHLMLVFPVVFFSLRLNLDGLLFPSARPLVLDKVRFSSISVGLICLIYLAANFVPSIWDAFQFTGSTATVSLGFIFPAAIALRDPYGISSMKDKILSVVMIVLAVFSNLVAIYSNVDSIFGKQVNIHS